MKLSVIVVNYNTKKITQECLRSIEKYPFAGKFEVIVVDNASTDGSREELAKFKTKKYTYRYIYNSQNLGFAKANNIGIKKSQGEYILLLNSDTLVLKNSINDMYDFTKKHADAGVVVPKLLNADKSIQPSVYKLHSLWRTVKEYWFRRRGLGEKYAPKSRVPIAVEAAVAAAFMITPQARKKAGLLNEKYFMYFEDLDYCRTVNKVGLKIYYLPSVAIVHLHGKSGESISDSRDQWRRLIPSSKTYHGTLVHYLRLFVMRTSQSPYPLLLAGVILLAGLLRVAYLDTNLFFGYEQGRDFLKLSEIFSGNLTLIGPKTDIDGLFHGALSYYILIPSFLVLGGNPYLMLLSLILLHLISIFFLFNFAKSLFGTKYAILTAFLYASSYTAVVFSRWLSNPNLTPALAIFILFFTNLSQKNKNYLPLAAFFWAVMFHLQIVAALVLVLPIGYFVLTRKIITLKNLTLSFLAVFITLSSYLVFNLKNGNILINSFVSYVSRDLGERSVLRLDEFLNQSVDEFFPPVRAVALVLAAIVILINIANIRNSNSKYLLLLYFSAPILFVVLRVTPLRHLFVMSSVFASLLIANAVFVANKKTRGVLGSLVLGLIVVGNLQTLVSRLPKSDRNFIYHAQRTYLSDMLNLTDYVYEEAKDQDFSYNYYSIPYWHDDAWEYVFLWYGNNRYGRLPVENRTNVFYVLIEPDETQPKYQEDWYRKLGSESRVLDSYKSGKLIVEKRQKL